MQVTDNFRWMGFNLDLGTVGAHNLLGSCGFSDEEEVKHTVLIYICTV